MPVVEPPDPIEVRDQQPASASTQDTVTKMLERAIPDPMCMSLEDGDRLYNALAELCEAIAPIAESSAPAAVAIARELALEKDKGSDKYRQRLNVAPVKFAQPASVIIRLVDAYAAAAELLEKE